MPRRARVIMIALAAVALAVVWSVPAIAAGAKADEAPMVFDAPPEIGTKARCPVSRMEFKVTKKTQRSEHKGKHYVFCCGGCKPKFDADPEKYLGEKPPDEPMPH